MKKLSTDAELRNGINLITATITSAMSGAPAGSGNIETKVTITLGDIIALTGVVETARLYMASPFYPTDDTTRSRREMLSASVEVLGGMLAENWLDDLNSATEQIAQTRG
jgi:hypothetical protein